MGEDTRNVDWEQTQHGFYNEKKNKIHPLDKEQSSSTRQASSLANYATEFASALVVLSSTAEDGEIEVRISVGLGTTFDPVPYSRAAMSVEQSKSLETDSEAAMSPHTPGCRKQPPSPTHWATDPGTQKTSTPQTTDTETQRTSSNEASTAPQVQNTVTQHNIVSPKNTLLPLETSSDHKDDVISEEHGVRPQKSQVGKSKKKSVHFRSPKDESPVSPGATDTTRRLTLGGRMRIQPVGPPGKTTEEGSPLSMSWAPMGTYVPPERRASAREMVNTQLLVPPLDMTTGRMSVSCGATSKPLGQGGTGRLKVNVRVKPGQQDSSPYWDASVVTLRPPPAAVGSNKTQSNPDKESSFRFQFDKVLGPSTSQEQLFQDTALLMVGEFVGGKNCLLFTHGTSGSGKTYTMLGNKGTSGSGKTYTMLGNKGTSGSGKTYPVQGIKRTYGSGKTYPVQGNEDQPGLIPKTLNFLFSSFDDRISKDDKYRLVGSNLTRINPKFPSTRVEGKERTSFCKNVKSSPRQPKSSVDLVRDSADTEDFGSTPPHKMDLQDKSSPTRLSLEGVKFSVFLSFSTIYDEGAFDLLGPFSSTKTNQNKDKNGTLLKIALDHNGGAYVKGLSQVCVISEEEAQQVFLHGQKKLQALTCSSHSVFTIKLARHVNNVTSSKAKINTFTFCDMTGCQPTNMAGYVKKDAYSIDNSLRVLWKCINTLRSNQQKSKARSVVPFQDSKLTQLLREPLLGNSLVTMIVTANLDPSVFDETLSVLRLANVAKEVIVPSVQQTLTNLTGLYLIKGPTEQARGELSRARDQREPPLPALKTDPDLRRSGFLTSGFPTLYCIQMCIIIIIIIIIIINIINNNNMSTTVTKSSPKENKRTSNPRLDKSNARRTTGSTFLNLKPSTASTKSKLIRKDCGFSTRTNRNYNGAVPNRTSVFSCTSPIANKEEEKEESQVYQPEKRPHVNREEVRPEDYDESSEAPKVSPSQCETCPQEQSSMVSQDVLTNIDRRTQERRGVLKQIEEDISFFDKTIDKNEDTSSDLLIKSFVEKERRGVLKQIEEDISFFDKTIDKNEDTSSDLLIKSFVEKLNLEETLTNNVTLPDCQNISDLFELEYEDNCDTLQDIFDSSFEPATNTATCLSRSSLKSETRGDSAHRIKLLAKQLEMSEISTQDEPEVDRDYKDRQIEFEDEVKMLDVKNMFINNKINIPREQLKAILNKIIELEMYSQCQNCEAKQGQSPLRKEDRLFEKVDADNQRPINLTHQTGDQPEPSQHSNTDPCCEIDDGDALKPENRIECTPEKLFEDYKILLAQMLNKLQSCRNKKNNLYKLSVSVEKLNRRLTKLGKTIDVRKNDLRALREILEELFVQSLDVFEKDSEHKKVHPTEIRTSISPSSAVELQHDKRLSEADKLPNELRHQTFTWRIKASLVFNNQAGTTEANFRFCLPPPEKYITQPGESKPSLNTCVGVPLGRTPALPTGKLRQGEESQSNETEELGPGKPLAAKPRSLVANIINTKAVSKSGRVSGALMNVHKSRRAPGAIQRYNSVDHLRADKIKSVLNKLSVKQLLCEVDEYGLSRTANSNTLRERLVEYLHSVKASNRIIQFYTRKGPRRCPVPKKELLKMCKAYNIETVASANEMRSKLCKLFMKMEDSQASKFKTPRRSSSLLDTLSDMESTVSIENTCRGSSVPRATSRSYCHKRTSLSDTDWTKSGGPRLFRGGSEGGRSLSEPPRHRDRVPPAEATGKENTPQPDKPTCHTEYLIFLGMSPLRK
uniref:(California timema) hypothetical protein n=1 Tax=Timema californicum TaxID=61474 RepID=A0A7R9J0M0_TIMCA|nr:unnamed protein product [Timema californicum]